MVYDPERWAEGSLVGVCIDTPIEHNVLFVNTATGAGHDEFPVNTWVTCDCSSFLPEDAKAVCLTTMLIITHGSQPRIADVTLEVRRFGAAVSYGNYSMQTIEAYTTGGQRSTVNAWVSLTDLKFEAYYHTPTGEPPWPAGSAYGLNMNVQAYIR